MTTEETLQESSLADDLAANLVTDEPSEAAPETLPDAEASPTPDEVAEVLEALEPPPKWDKRYKEVFNEWGGVSDDGTPQFARGRDYQQAMYDLWHEGQSYSTKVEQERAEARKQAEQYEGYLRQFDSVFQPYNPLIAELGTTPDQFARQGMGLLQALRNDPKGTVKRLIQEGNIDLSALAGEQEWVSPESKQIQALQRKLAQMEQGTAQREMRQAQEARARIERENASQLEAFASAKDDAGNPLHPHLEAVQETMAQLIYGREDMRRANPGMARLELDEAYDMACKLHPDIQAEAQTKAEAKRIAEKAAEAKKATEASKRVKSGSAGKEPSDKSLRDEIRANLKSAA